MTQPAQSIAYAGAVDTSISIAKRESAAPLDRAYVLGAILWALALGALFFYLLAYVSHAANLAVYPYDLDQGEGYDVNSGWLIAQGRPIYTDNSQYPYYSSNYPPVYSFLIAPILVATGPSLAPGRIVSAVAALLTALLIGVAIGRRAELGAAGLTAALLFLGSVYVFHTTPLARVNALALLFAVGGLLCCLSTARSAIAAAVLLFLLALFTKQTMLDAVAAGLLAILLRDRKAGIVAGAVLGALGLALLVLIDWLHGGAFWVNIVLGNANPFDVGQALSYYRNFVETHLVLLGLAGCQVVRAARTGRLGPLELYWLIAMWGAVSVGKWGAGESYFLAPIAASALLAGQEVALWYRRAVERSVILPALGGLLLLQAVLFAHGPLYRLGPVFADHGAQASMLSRQPGEADIRAARPLVDHLRQSDGPVLVEDPGYGLAIGKEVVGNATHLRNLYLAGIWSPDNLVADLRERRFDWVVLNAELYPEPVLEAIGRYYFLLEEYEINGTTQRLFAPGAE